MLLSSFLQGRPRDDKPDQIKYRYDDDGKPNDLYWEHLMEYEQTKLRPVFPRRDAPTGAQVE